MLIHENVLLYNNSMRWMTQLEELNVSANRRLWALPAWLGDITSLKVLNVAGCEMDYIPEW